MVDHYPRHEIPFVSVTVTQYDRTRWPARAGGHQCPGTALDEFAQRSGEPGDFAHADCIQVASAAWQATKRARLSPVRAVMAERRVPLVQ